MPVMQSAMPCYERGNPEALNKSRRDQRLLVALRTGSSSAFEELQKLYSSRLYERLLSITRNHETGYPSGTVLALVTWNQRDDPHWFGGRIPDTPLRVEFVQTFSGSGADIHRVFEGKALAETHADTQNAAQRTDFILTLKLVSLP